jgi:uncharacterized membrane protein
MNEKFKKVTFWLALFGGLKLILQANGIEIPDETINSIANGLGGIFGLVGIVKDHVWG